MEPADLAAALTKASSATRSLLDISVKRAVDLQTFMDQPSLGPAIQQAVDLYRSVGVTSRAGLEGEVKASFRHLEVQDAWEELLHVENAWDAFLGGVDRSLGCGAEVSGLREGELPNLGLKLLDSRSGAETSLGEVLRKTEGQHLHLVLLRHFA